MVGKRFKYAKASLLALGLQVSRTYKVSTTRRAGTVLSQSPSAGSDVSLGTTIKLVVAKASATPAGITCPANPLLGVYHPYRLTVLKTCQWFVGTVVAVRPEDDGDHHVDIAPDKGYGGFLNTGDTAHQDGGLLIEIMPGQTLPLPFIGEHVSVFGTWVYDTSHGWREFHPVWAIKYLDTGKLVKSIPPATPVYTGSTGTSPQPTATGVNNNPWGYNFSCCNRIYSPPSSFCSYFPCISSFWNGSGYVVQCADLEFSKSGGKSGVCSYHGGYYRTLYSP